MAQVEKRGGLLRKSSASKKPLKEKVVLMYDEIFMTEDPSKCSPRFWEELFLMKVNLEYLEGKLESLDGEELMKIKDNINCLFQHCIQALGEEHPIRVVNALQTLCALIRGVHQKNKSTSGFDIINMLIGFDKAELCMKVRHKLQMCLWMGASDGCSWIPSADRYIRRFGLRRIQMIEFGLEFGYIYLTDLVSLNKGKF
uniref:Armadillo like helical domain containing 3 n=1 Tax=Prolemur simus TaxID=1328070 RepID=A0A8C9AK05_PROSS